LSTLGLELSPLDRQAAEAIFGPRPVEDALLELVDAEECFFLASSAGMLFGLRLAGGSRVALKAVRARPGLAEARAVQEALHANGFPCPRPIAGPLPFGAGVAFVDEWVEAPQRDVHEPARRAEAARTLARLVDSAPPAPELPRALEPARGAVFPEPHHPRFDFARPDGAWIDEAAAGALRERVRSGPAVVGHSDWSAKHFGWDGDRLAVVYDWPDSLVCDAEETIVGHASLVFPATWDVPVATYVASADESEAFVAEYEAASGRRLDRAKIAAARAHLLAYCARCELSDLDDEGDFQRALRQLR
jgi:Phosphotransferase enzyme family